MASLNLSSARLKVLYKNILHKSVYLLMKTVSKSLQFLWLAYIDRQENADMIFITFSDGSGVTETAYTR